MNDHLDSYEHLDEPAIPDRPETPEQRAKRISRRVANPMPNGRARSANFNPSWTTMRHERAEAKRVVKQPESPAWMAKPLKPPGRS